MRNLDYIWGINERKLPRARKWLVRFTKRAMITWECITKNYLMNYASSLTYNSMLAAVPVLAILFAVARGFGYGAVLEDQLRTSLEVKPQLANTLINFVDSYLRHTKDGVFIGVGLLFLLYSVVSLTSNIEKAFNTIWYVKKSRSVYRQVTDYVSVFLLLPFTIVIVSGLNIFLMTLRNRLPDYQIINETVDQALRFSPVVVSCAVFVLLYKLMPNTKVLLRHTLWPGVCAGALFMAIEYVYVHYQIKLSSYNAIYGSFAAIPLFMLWLQISWSVCLIGAQLCYANQCLDNYAFERMSDDLSRRYRDTLCLLLMTRIAKRFARGETPYTEQTLTRETRLPESMVRTMLSDLVAVQLLAETHDEGGSATRYLPAVDIHRLTVRMVTRRIDSRGEENPSRGWQSTAEGWSELRRLRNQGEDALLVDIQ